MLIWILAIVQQVGFTIAYVPQIWQLLRTKHTQGINLFYYWIRLMCLGLLSWLYILIKSYPLFWVNWTSILAELIIIIVVIVHRRKK